MTDSRAPLFQHVGLAIKIFREYAGLSQAALATQAGIGKSQLSKYESGKEYPKLDSLERVLVALGGVTPFSFFYVVNFLDRAKKGVGSVDQLGGFWIQLGPPALGSVEEAFVVLMQSLFKFIQAKADGSIALAAAPSTERSNNLDESLGARPMAPPGVVSPAAGQRGPADPVAAHPFGEEPPRRGAMYRRCTAPGDKSHKPR